MIRIIPLALLVLGTSTLSAQVTIIQWGPSADYVNSNTNFADADTSTQAGTLNGNEGNFRYRSHTTAIMNQTYVNPPPSPNFGWAAGHWQAGGAPNLVVRIGNEDQNNLDSILIANTTSGSGFGVNLLWWNLSEAEDATARVVSTNVQLVADGTAALMAQQGTQWYIANPGAGLTVSDVTTLTWVAYNPVDGSPVSMFANSSGVDTVAALSGSTFGAVTLDNITAMGLYYEFVNDTGARRLSVQEFTVIPEPRVYAALFGLFALGFVAWRRRR